MILYRQLREAFLSVPHRPATLAGGAFTPAKREELLKAPLLAPLLEEIRAEADRAAREPTPELPFAIFHRYSAFGTRKEYESPYFERRGRLLALTLATLVDDTDAYAEALENIIWDICGEYAWSVPAHLPDSMEAVLASRVPPERVVDLFAAETAHALAETLYLVGDRLNAWVIHRVKEEIERRVFVPVFESSVHFPWQAMTNNWSAVCGGAVGMAALLLVDDRERLAGMQIRVVSAMESFLAGYGEDGCCPEGYGYWNYGFGYFVYWAEMLREYTGGAIDLLQRDKIKRIAEFPAAVALSASTCINYSDCDPAFMPNTGLISRLSDRLGIAPPEMTALPSLHADHCYRWPHQVRNLLWTNPKRMFIAAEEGIRHYPSTDWLIAKHGAPGGLIAFSAKGGHNHEPHNHNDLGHFVLHVGGDTLLADLGAGVYSREYFGPQRYSFLHNASEGHSVPLINGHPQAAGEKHRAVVTSKDTNGGDVRFELDLTSAYPQEAGLQSFSRAFEWHCDPRDSRARLTITDRFGFAESAAEGETGSVTEHFISECKPVVRDDKIVWRSGKGVVTLRFEPSLFKAEVEALETGRHDTSPATVFRVRLLAERLQRQFACRFVLDCHIPSTMHDNS